MNLTWQRLFLLLAFGGVLTAIYFGNVAYQSSLGRQALAKTGLQSLSLPEAIRVARTEKKQILVDVSAIWCPVCRALDQSVFSNVDVQEVIKNHYVFCRLEYQSPEGTSFLRDHEAQGFPNLWVLDRNGGVVKHLPTTLSVNQFLDSLPD